MKKILTIIVTYNGMQWLDRCLSAMRQSSIQTTVMVIDNCSTDGTREFVPSHYPEVLWMPQQCNLGFGQANNLGMRYALDNGFDYVLLLNQDAYLQPYALSIMLSVSDGKSVISPLQLTGDGSRLDPMFRVSMRLTCDVSQLIDDLLLCPDNMKDIYDSAEIGAACWLVPVSVLQQLGGFDPMFFHYSEDNNYYQRMTYHGVGMQVVPKAHVWHDRKLFVGNLTAFNHNRLRRDLLVEACNINFGLIKCLVRFLKVLFRCYYKDLGQKQYRIGAWTMQMFWLLCHLGQIRKSRMANKTLQSNWL